MMFTSDVSLPKGDKTTMPGEQITAGQLTGLKTHHNANYVARELEVQLYGQYAKTSRLFIHKHLLTNHPPSDTYPEHLAGIKLRAPPKV